LLDSARPQAPSWRTLLTGRWAISLRAWLIIAVLMQWPSYARNSVPTQLSPTWAIAIGVLRVLAAGLVLWVADRTYLRRRASRPAALWVVIATWLVAGAATMVVQWAAFEVLDEPGISPMRWTISSVTFALRSALCAYYFGLRDYWSQSARDLSATTQQLMNLRAKSRAELQDVRARVRAIVVDQVVPSVRRLQAELGDDSSQMARDRVEQLSRIASAYSQDVVRAASHRVSDLTSLSDSPVPTAPDKDEARLLSPKMTPDARPPLLISVRWSLLVFGVTLLPLAFTAPPDDPVLPILLGLSIVVAMLAGGAWLQTRLGGRTRSTWWSTTWTAGTAIVGIGLQVAIGLLPARVITPIPLIGLIIITFAAAMLGASMARHLGRIRLRVDELAGALNEVSAINNSLQDELAAEKRRVATLLHGPVQGRLAAVALLLKLDSGTGDTGHMEGDTRARCRVILDQVMQDLTAVVEGTFEDVQPLEERLARLARGWHGIAAVTLRLDPDLYAAVVHAPGLCLWIFEIVEEGINNAVTHGHATSIEVRALMIADGVEVMVADDGTGCDPSAERGLGLSTIGRSPALLRLTPIAAGGTLLTVRLPWMT